MGKIRHPAVKDLPYTATVGAPTGVEVVELGGLFARAQSHGNDPCASLRPAFHQLIAVRGRPLRLAVDFVEHELPPGAWLWIRPGQVQRYGRDLPDADGSVVVFQPGFLPPATVAAADMGPPCLQKPILPSGRDAQALRLGLEHLAFEYAAMSSLPLASHVEVLRHLVSVLVLRLAKLKGGPAVQGQRGEVFRRLFDAVERDHAVTRRVEDYAAALGYSPRTLSRATQAATGMSAKKYIDERVLLEAKRLLLHSDLPAKTVAAALGFADPSDFTKFFRARTGAPPGDFRVRTRDGTTRP